MSKTCKSKNNIWIGTELFLSRNLSTHKFPLKLSTEEGREVVDIVSKIFLANKKYKFKKVNLWEESKETIYLWLEYGAITLKLYENREFSSFLVDEKNRVIIMINEENHITISLKSRYLSGYEVYLELEELISGLDEKLDIAYTEKLGYFTSNLNKVGSGFKASYIMHIPICINMGFLEFIKKGLEKTGFTINDVFSDENKGLGNIYRISNIATMGISYKAIISELDSIKNKIIMKEKKQRELEKNMDEDKFLDNIFRAKGILQNARKISFSEAIKLLSVLRMGIEMKIIDGIDSNKINEIIIASKHNHIKQTLNDKFNKGNENVVRANLIKGFLQNI